MAGELITQAAADPAALLAEDLWQRWLEFVDAKPATIATYARAMRSFFGWLQAEEVQSPQRPHILMYRDSLRSRLKAASVQTYMSAVRLFFRWTAQEGIYPDIADHVKGARVGSEHKRDPLTSRQARLILESIDRGALSGLRDYAMLALMLTTGLRTVSVAAANVGDIRTAGDSTVLYYLGKGRDDKSEYVKLAEPVEEAIRAYLKARGRAGSKAPLFASVSNHNNGGRLTTRSISRIAKTAMQAAGYDSDRLTAHSLRHTAATLNLLNGGTIEETQQLLGHSSVTTTMIYAHALERAANDSEARIAGILF